jgi:hypothetical protein
VAFEPFAAIGAATQGAARLLGLSKSARLRRSINEDVKLYGSLEGHDELKQAAAQVAGLVELETNQLVVREIIAANRSYDWSNLIVGVFLAGLCALPLIWTFPPQALWHWPVAIFSASVAVLFLVFGATMVRKQPKVEDLFTPNPEAGDEPPPSDKP